MSFPISRLEDLLHDIGSKQPKYFSVLDMNSAFFQFPLKETDKHKSAFVTRHGHYQYTRVSFGLKPSPIFFTSAMSKILEKFIKSKQAFIYADDIIVCSTTLDEHLETLSNIFATFRKKNLTFDPKKSKFIEQKVKYLGHFLDPNGITVDPEKIELVKNFPRPKTVKHVQQFLGLANYYKRFCENYSKVAKPLFQLLKKDTKFDWTTECETAFQGLQNKLITAPILTFANPNKKYIITTDASQEALGFILSQLDDTGKEKVIEYGGRSLTETERKLAPPNLEALAVVTAV